MANFGNLACYTSRGIVVFVIKDWNINISTANWVRKKLNEAQILLDSFIPIGMLIGCIIGLIFGMFSRIIHFLQ